MAKKSDNNDPIEFEIKYGQREWIPTPTNKPNWKYLDEVKHKPNFLTSIINITLGTIFTLLSLGALVLVFYRTSITKENFLAVITAIALFAFMLYLGLATLSIPIKQYIHYKKNKEQKPKARKKKQPKRRKDYG